MIESTSVKPKSATSRTQRLNISNLLESAKARVKNNNFHPETIESTQYKAFAKTYTEKLNEVLCEKKPNPQKPIFIKKSLKKPETLIKPAAESKRPPLNPAPKTEAKTRFIRKTVTPRQLPETRSRPRFLSLCVPSQSSFSCEEFVWGRIIGQGSYAVVREATNKENKLKFAVKTYEKVRLLDPNKKKSVQREIRILEKIEHPNIIKLIGTMESIKQLHLVLNLVEGNSLASYVKNKVLEENEARILFRQLAEAVLYIHSKSVIHRDIKLENILFDAKGNLVLIDFGFSVILKKGRRLSLFCGTPTYMAPEITYKADYEGAPTDIWAMGVLLYKLLTGNFPFTGKTDRELFRKIEKNPVKFPPTLSSTVKDLLTQMLVKSPENRINASKVLESTWICESGIFGEITTLSFEEPTSDTIDLDIVANIKKLGFSEDQIMKDLRDSQSQVNLLYSHFRK